ncbi:MAG: chemotaxis-specific protein-glutamate methyltransferase CheB [Vampirovibrionales bacterium]|nr:chemotaxis-specific protein-glutamate methyltransferase CheB [Vampirovibrionales bacterium]
MKLSRVTATKITGRHLVTQDITLNILIADDSLTYRMILKQALKGLEHFTLLDTAIHGEDALNKLDQLNKQDKRVDLVLMDIEMPVMDGLTALPLITSRYPDTKVVLVSGLNRNAADMTIEALQRGALDFIPKPNGDSATDNLAELHTRLKTLFDIVRMRLAKKAQKSSNKAIGNTTSPLRKTPLTPPASAGKKHENSAIKSLAASFRLLTPPKHISALAIGSSTGGPNALITLIPSLPASLGIPVFVVQHMPPLFTASLAKSLNDKSALTVKEAEDGEIVKPNTVYVAPGGYHMQVTQSRRLITIISLNQEPPENSCRPAVDPLFRSVATVYGKAALAVVLTGMGSDGTKGLKALKGQGGGYVITQDESSCVVYGMPRSAVEAGLSDEQLPLSIISSRIQSIMGLTQTVSLSNR